MLRSVFTLVLVALSYGAALANPTCPPEIPSVQIERVQEVQKPFFLDVREPEEIRETGSLEGYVNIPLGELEHRLDEIPRDRPILTA